MAGELRGELTGVEDDRFITLPSTYGNYSPFFPNPIICFSEILSSTATVFYNNLIPWNGIHEWLKETWEWHYVSIDITSSDIICPIVLALLFTLLRYVLYKLLLEHIPKWYGLTTSDGEKFPEAAFRTISYAFLWILAVAAVVKIDLFFVPINFWNDWIPGSVVPSNIYWIYMLQIGFYLHMMYATTYIETVRKDYLVQMIHHVITLALLTYSYSLRFYKMGLLVLFIHDFADILLELAKCFIYFKTMNGVYYKLPEVLANITFAVFVLEWILFRLYWFPVKLLYATGCISYKYYRDAPFFCPFNILLWALYFLHIYWFYFILLLVIKVITGKELADNRDYEENKKEN